MEVKKIVVYRLTDLKHKVLSSFVILILAGLIYIFFNRPEKLGNQIVIFKGNLAYNNGAFDDAEVLYKTALKKKPHLDNVLYNLGNAYYKQDRYPEAIQSYLKGLLNSTGSLSVEIWNNLGNAYYMAGHLNLSAEAYKKALLLNHDDLKIRQNLLFVLSKMDTSKIALIKKEEKDKSANNNKNENAKTNDKDGKKTDQHSETPADKMSASNIADLFNLINQNEHSAGSRINKIKSKNKAVVSTGQDY